MSTGPEMEELKAHLEGASNFHVDWGPDAAALTVEERAAALNKVFDELADPVLDLAARLSGEAGMEADSAMCSLSQFETTTMSYVAASPEEKRKARRHQELADLLIEAATMLRQLHATINGGPAFS